MSIIDLKPFLDRVEILGSEINQFVPSSPTATQFRADLAGMLVVSIAASYESCVKETLVNYANGHHIQFGEYVQNRYKKINSRISISDLHEYARVFGGAASQTFKDRLQTRRARINNLIGKDIIAAYGQILNWRHDFAHAGIRNTTVDEALATHRLARHVIYMFDAAFI